MSENPLAKDDKPPWFVQEHSKFMRGTMRACLIAFCCIDALNIAFSIYILFFDTENTLPHPVSMAIFFSSFWTAWVVVSIWLVLDTERSRLCLFETHMEEHGIWRTSRIEWKEVTAIYWGSFGRSITVTNARTTICIPVRKFTFRSHHDQLIEFFRLQFSKQIQVNYELFKATRLLPAISARKPLSMTEKLFRLPLVVLMILDVLGFVTGTIMQSGMILALSFAIWLLIIAIGFWSSLSERRQVYTRFCQS